MIENGERMEQWEDIKDFNFSSFCLVESEKVEKWKKVNLYKFTYILLLKNDGQLKQINEKKKITQLIKKKSCSKKKKNHV